MGNYQLWNSHKINGGKLGWGILVNSSQIIHTIANEDNFAATEYEKAELLKLYEQSGEEEMSVEDWAVYAQIAIRPQAFYSDEDVTIIDGNQIYANYADLLTDFYEDYQCFRTNNPNHKIECCECVDDFAEVEDEQIILHTLENNVWSGKLKNGKVLVMIYPNRQDEYNIGKIMTAEEYFAFAEGLGVTA